eukprot:TRINITY_DN15891_c0_g1_i3.p1 TRINITY_DN15891_c0_g1~~TRINITY_DN15891_c0_g1_i3.p1  ORF type:complete len:214 (-),score=80.33 TRINITY_DN15891_c0_g1_i3:391-1032(-)
MEEILSLFFLVLTCCNIFQFPEWGKISKSVIDLITRLLSSDPSERPTAHQLLQNPWVKGEEASTRRLTGTIKTIKKYNIARKTGESMRKKDEVTKATVFNLFDEPPGAQSPDEEEVLTQVTSTPTIPTPTPTPTVENGKAGKGKNKEEKEKEKEKEKEAKKAAKQAKKDQKEQKKKEKDQKKGKKGEPEVGGVTFQDEKEDDKKKMTESKKKK